MPVGRGLATARAPTPTALSRAAFLNLQHGWRRVRRPAMLLRWQRPTTGSVTRTACPLSAHRVRVPFPRHALCRGPSGHARLNPATNAPSSPPPRDAAARHRTASAQRDCPAQCGATSLCVTGREKIDREAAHLAHTSTWLSPAASPTLILDGLAAGPPVGASPPLRGQVGSTFMYWWLFFFQCLPGESKSAGVGRPRCAVGQAAGRCAFAVSPRHVILRWSHQTVLLDKAEIN